MDYGYALYIRYTSRMARRRRFASVSLPVAVVKLVDDFIDWNTQGYGTRPEVINAAIRRFLRDEMPELKQPPVEEPARKRGRRAKS